MWKYAQLLTFIWECSHILVCRTCGAIGRRVGTVEKGGDGDTDALDYAALQFLRQVEALLHRIVPIP